MPESVTAVPTQLAGLSSQEFSELVQRANRSVVVVEFEDRDEKAFGLGSGFVIDKSGLIATNLHVIGEARPISVRFSDGRTYDVVEIHATDKTEDVAILRVDAQDLPALPLAMADGLHQAQPVFALGNPLGLEHSVVTGIVSGFRDNDDGTSLIQLAIPIERGNSGGPLLDMQGRVHGLLTLKSLVTENLGYAVRINAVHKLLESPNPIPMSTWLTIGTLNPKLWEPAKQPRRGRQLGVRWRQRAGRIRVEGTGDGFGGRALCFFQQVPPRVPFELAVDVKIDQDDGAAGLIFHADGDDRHYGFYPSSGRLRLSRFDGPTVYSWNVLEEVHTSHFRPNEWNRLKIRIEKERISCYCNDHLVIESRDDVYTTGRVGLSKFRHTSADFKRFSVAKEIASDLPTAADLARVEELSQSIDPHLPPSPELLNRYADFDKTGQRALREQARRLEARAEQLRQLSRELHEQQVRADLVEVLCAREDQPVQLLRAALLLAALDNDELQVADYESLVDQLASEFLKLTSEDEPPESRLAAFHDFLFEQQGFHGSRTNYYHASNSYLNEVIDDREGLPITLSVLYLALLERVGLRAEGVGLPGHFIVRVHLTDHDSRLIDVFDGGVELSEGECRQLVRATSRLTWDDSFLDSQDAKAVITRMLRNLIQVAKDEEDLEAALRYVKTILAIDPDSVEDHLYKAVFCYGTNRISEGLAEVDWVMERQPDGVAMDRVIQLREALLNRREE